jgi:hypothetical protein
VLRRCTHSGRYLSARAVVAAVPRRTGGQELACSRRRRCSKTCRQEETVAVALEGVTGAQKVGGRNYSEEDLLAKMAFNFESKSSNWRPRIRNCRQPAEVVARYTVEAGSGKFWWETFWRQGRPFAESRTRVTHLHHEKMSDSVSP